ncbi:hypothetical protein A9Q91_02425 [Candidatus Gracilibacteria bacterium 28_42_T64]|nr:hypothetical protein A9Q91_02425 [Candidatus Gracilibacteria bacterium 28_42_T64]
MFNKKFFILATGYVMGGLVSSFYNKKKPEQLKTELKKARKNGDGDFQVLLNSFLDTHKNLIQDIEKELLTEKNKELFHSKKEELLNIATVYQTEGNKLIAELKSQGKDFIVEASDTLEKLYNEKKDELDTFKDISPKKVENLKDNLLASFEELKEVIKNEIKSEKKK